MYENSIPVLGINFKNIQKLENCKGNSAQKTNYSLDNFYRLLPDNIKENESYIFANRS